MTAAVPLAPDDAPATDRPRRLRRLALMLALPLALLLIGGYVWVTGGRYVETENAYVHQGTVAISADVPGRISAVSVHENQAVDAGQVLFSLDDRPYRLAVERAEAAIASARLQVDQLRAAYAESLAEHQAAEQEVAFRQRAFERQDKLSRGGYASQAAQDEARHELQTAEERLAKARQGVASARAALAGDPDVETDRHPLVQEAIAQRNQARLDLDHTVVRAPAAGLASQTDRMRVGQYVPTGTAVLSLVETGDSWIEANLKETDLAHLAVGQPATVEFDAYPGRVLTATVASIGAGTGAEFSLLPAENATGNWVKVVQRVPVRLRLETVPEMPLRTGLSAAISIDTGHSRALPSPIRSALAVAGVYHGRAAE